MLRVGLLSDTHGFLDKEIEKFFSDIDEIWHAGDIGSEEILDRLEAKNKLRAVYGNIDSHEIRIRTHEHLRFQIEGVSVWITHIGGYPKKYAPHVKSEIVKNPPNLFISGHSHILKVMRDKELDLLHINPGAAGNYGWHKLITCVKFELNCGNIENLQILEKQRKS